MATIGLNSLNLSDDRTKGDDLFPDVCCNLFNTHHTILIVDSYAHQIPWESLPLFRHRSVSRFLSSQTLTKMLPHYLPDQGRDILQIHPDKMFYVLNPDGDLKNTEADFVDLFKS